MAQRRTGRPILDLAKHDLSGYRKGCGCPTCRAAHAADMAKYRARKRRERELEQMDDEARAQAQADALPPEPDESQAPLLLDPDAPAGPVEEAVLKDLDSLIGEPPWKATLSALAKANARIVDQVYRHQRLDVLSGVQLRMMDILDRLRRVPDGSGGGVPADWGAQSLAEPD